MLQICAVCHKGICYKDIINAIKCKQCNKYVHFKCKKHLQCPHYNEKIKVYSFGSQSGSKQEFTLIVPPGPGYKFTSSPGYSVSKFVDSPSWLSIFATNYNVYRILFGLGGLKY